MLDEEALGLLADSSVGDALARVTGYATGGVEPKWVMMAPVDAARRLEKKLGKATTDYDLYELNEAFSAAACAVSRSCAIVFACTLGPIVTL